MTTAQTILAPKLGLFASIEERRSFIQAWKRLAAAKQLTAADMLLRAHLLEQDPKRSFAPITNVVKLANGQTAYDGLARTSLNLWSAVGPMLYAFLPELNDAPEGAKRHTELMQALKPHLSGYSAA